MKARGLSIAAALAIAVGLVPALGSAVPPESITVGQAAVRDAAFADVYKQVLLVAVTQPGAGTGLVEIDGKRSVLACVSTVQVPGGHELVASTKVKNGTYWSIVLWDNRSGKDFAYVLRHSSDAGGECGSGLTLPFARPALL
jgi:hypothetical protein